MKQPERESFYFRKLIFREINKLPPSQQTALYNAVCEYALFEELPNKKDIASKEQKACWSSVFWCLRIGVERAKHGKKELRRFGYSSKEMTNYFVFYARFYHAIKSLSTETQLLFYRQICKYGLYQQDNGAMKIERNHLTEQEKGIWALIFHELQTNWKRRVNGIRGKPHGIKGKEFGANGGAPKGNINNKKQQENGDTKNFQRI